MNTDNDRANIVVVGAGAAGLMAAIQAGRAARALRIVVLDGARTLGAKILISGGGRCNVTHHRVDTASYVGSSRNAIGKVLRSYDVASTVEFFAELGVELKQEETGKLFPTTDSARTVLDALVRAAAEAGVELRFPRRVETITTDDPGFRVSGEWGVLSAGRVILATGGCSIPKSGSDGHGFRMVRELGHTVTRTFPALVPLTLPREHWIPGLKGVSADAELTVVSATGKRLETLRGSLLCTHFGLSGPVAMDVSRHLAQARFEDPGAGLRVNWIPGESAASFLEQAAGHETAARVLRRHLPQRLADALCVVAGVDPALRWDQVRRELRRDLVRETTDAPLPVTGDRGYNYAEVTAGGVPLGELHLESMASRRCEGLYLCGEICDVDGRIGGFNFQWAWASGYLAGRGAIRGGSTPSPRSTDSRGRRRPSTRHGRDATPS